MNDGERLRQARLARGWTQRETAAYAGVSPQFWNDVEFGRRAAPDGTYAAMCAAVGLASDRPAAEVERLRARVAELEAEVAGLREQVQRLIEQHGTFPYLGDKSELKGL